MKIILLLTTFLSSVFLMIVFWRYAIYRQAIDIPNERSSHTLATPTGAGLAIALAFLPGLVVLNMAEFLDLNTLIAISGASVLVAGVGFWDDLSYVPKKWRLLTHFISAFWILYWLDLNSHNAIFDFNYTSGWLIFFLASILLVWLLNLYNFMDGVDGIAASEAIFIAGVIGCFSYIEGKHDLALVSALLAVATAGFLIFNWPPAKIFMGDAGSGFLGIVLGGLVFSWALETGNVWPGLILYGVFFIDATVTLIVRFMSGERWYEAHCSHAYQHAAKKWGHLRVTLTVSIINFCWLLPLSYIAYKQPASALVTTIIAFSPLLLAAFILGAGRRDHVSVPSETG